MKLKDVKFRHMGRETKEATHNLAKFTASNTFQNGPDQTKSNNKNCYTFD